MFRVENLRKRRVAAVFVYEIRALMKYIQCSKFIFIYEFIRINARNRRTHASNDSALPSFFNLFLPPSPTATRYPIRVRIHTHLYIYIDRYTNLISFRERKNVFVLCTRMQVSIWRIDVLQSTVLYHVIRFGTRPRPEKAGKAKRTRVEINF